MIDKKGVIISKKDYLDISRFILKAPALCTNKDIKQAVMEEWPYLDLKSASLGRRIRKLRDLINATPPTDKKVEQMIDRFSRSYRIAKSANMRLREKKQLGPKPKHKPEVEAERKKEYVDLRTKTAKMLSVKVGDIGKKWALC